MKIRPANGAAADISFSINDFRSVIITFPIIYYTHVSSSILGVGASNRAKGVKWSTAQRMVVTWVIFTYLSCFSSNYLFYYSSVLKIKRFV